MRLYGEIIPSFSEGIIDRTGTQTMLYLTCTTITSVYLAQYGVSRAKDWVSVDCGTSIEKGQKDSQQWPNGHLQHLRSHIDV